MADDKLVVPAQPQPHTVAINSSGIIQLRTLDETWRLSKAIFASGLAPSSLKNEQAVLVCILMGTELGLGPMQSIQSIAVINGRPSIYGDTALALVRMSGLLEDYSQVLSGEGDARSALVRVKRKGEELQEFTFSVADAKKAQLWGKNVWAQYPDRMLMFRARGFALRDCFGDVLRGFRTVEESQDIPAEDRGAQPALAQVVPEAAEPPKRRGRSKVIPPVDAELDYPDDGTMTSSGDSTPPVPAGEQSPIILTDILARLAREGATAESFLEVLHSVNMIGPDVKQLEDVPVGTLQMCLDADNWDDVRAHLAERKK